MKGLEVFLSFKKAARGLSSPPFPRPLVKGLSCVVSPFQEAQPRFPIAESPGALLFAVSFCVGHSLNLQP